MKRITLVLVIALLVLSFVGVAMATDSYTISQYSGVIEHGSVTIVDNSCGWRSAPKDPQTVYIEIVAPNIKLKDTLKSALTNMTRAHGLKPVYVNEPIINYDLKGRIVIVYLPIDFWRDGFLRSEYGVSGILYYSYAGDAKTFATSILNRNIPKITEKNDRKARLRAENFKR